MHANHPHFWSELCRRFRTEHSDLFRSWFEELRPRELRAGEIVVEASDDARLHYLRGRCALPISQLASEMTGMLLSVAFEAAESAGAVHAMPLPEDEPSTLDADYTFDEFVVGSQNRLAHAACRSVADEPGANYNPLFIHGPSGLGKSHLVHAVCSEIRKTHPRLAVVYVTCEKFVNDYVGAMTSGTVDDFRDKYRTADVLAIDDVQFLAKQESSHDEFFHTFNALHQARRQILISADTSPREIPTIAERLVSRFNWGLVVTIAAPDQETRRAILRKKAQLRGYDAADEVLDMIAARVESNVRVLEGALIKVVIQCGLSGSKYDSRVVEAVLDEVCGPEPRQLHISEILEMVTNYYGIRLAELLGKRRHRSVVQPRHVGMYLARRLTTLSLEEIGGHFGGRDHSTVLHAENAIEDLRKVDHKTEQTLAILTQRLLSKQKL